MLSVPQSFLSFKIPSIPKSLRHEKEKEADGSPKPHNMPAGKPAGRNRHRRWWSDVTPWTAAEESQKGKIRMEDLIGLLRIKIRRGIDLIECDAVATSSDPYVIITMDTQKLKTRCVANSCNPEWNEDLTLGIYNPDLPLKLEVYDQDVFMKDDPMGDAVIDIKAFIECRGKELGDVESGTVLSRMDPDDDNCLSEASEIVWKDGNLVQDMVLKLKNVQKGLVEIQLQWINLPKGG